MSEQFYIELSNSAAWGLRRVREGGPEGPVYEMFEADPAGNPISTGLWMTSEDLRDLSDHLWNVANEIDGEDGDDFWGFDDDEFIVDQPIEDFWDFDDDEFIDDEVIDLEEELPGVASIQFLDDCIVLWVDGTPTMCLDVYELEALMSRLDIAYDILNRAEGYSDLPI